MYYRIIYQNAPNVNTLESKKVKKIKVSSLILSRFSVHLPVKLRSEDKGALEWVFQIAGGQAQHVKQEELPEKTLLQRSLKEKLLQGIAPGSARGRLARLFV